MANEGNRRLKTPLILVAVLGCLGCGGMGEDIARVEEALASDYPVLMIWLSRSSELFPPQRGGFASEVRRISYAGSSSGSLSGIRPVIDIAGPFFASPQEIGCNGSVNDPNNYIAFGITQASGPFDISRYKHFWMVPDVTRDLSPDCRGVYEQTGGTLGFSLPGMQPGAAVMTGVGDDVAGSSTLPIAVHLFEHGVGPHSNPHEARLQCTSGILSVTNLNCFQSEFNSTGVPQSMNALTLDTIPTHPFDSLWNETVGFKILWGWVSPSRIRSCSPTQPCSSVSLAVEDTASPPLGSSSTALQISIPRANGRFLYLENRSHVRTGGCPTNVSCPAAGFPTCNNCGTVNLPGVYAYAWEFDIPKLVTWSPSYNGAWNGIRPLPFGTTVTLEPGVQVKVLSNGSIASVKVTVTQ